MKRRYPSEYDYTDSTHFERVVRKNPEGKVKYTSLFKYEDTPFIKKLGYKFIELNKYLSSSKSLLEIDDVVSKITFLMSSRSDDLNGVNIPLTKSK